MFYRTQIVFVEKSAHRKSVAKKDYETFELAQHLGRKPAYTGALLDTNLILYKELETITTMELPHIGQTCVICKRSDYLPFKCTHCDKTVCIDHKTDHGSECPLNRSHYENLTNDGCPSESLKRICDHCKKITLKLELTECAHCKTFNCLYHRHQVQHNCPQLIESRETLREEAEKRTERQTAALDKLKANIKSFSGPQDAHSMSLRRAQPLDQKKRELARRVRVMKIKQFARGPPNISQEDKIYFEIRFQHEPRSPLSQVSKDETSVKIFTTPKHTIGRMLDWSADELGVVNKNHLAETSQLVFKKVNDFNSELIILDCQKNFSHYLDNNELQDGDEIILTYNH